MKKINVQRPTVLKMKKIKVLHVLHSVGGVDVYLRLTCRTLSTKDIECIVIHGNNDTDKNFVNQNGQKIKSYKTSIDRAISPFKDLKAIYQTLQIFRKERPDVVHAHSAKGGIVARAASLFYKVTVLYTPHAFSYLSASSSLKRKLYLSIERTFKHFNSVLLACSNSERIRGIKEVGYNPDRALTMNNCIPPIEPSELNTSGLKLPESYICTVGRPSFQKNIEMMVEVIYTLKKTKPSIHLVIMGVGEYSPNKENVEHLIEDLDLSDNITMIPWIERNKILSIISNSRLYISTARYEGLPYSVIEALALGKASVVTKCDGNKDLIQNNYNGFVVEDYSVETMANRILALLKDDALRVEFESNAKALYHSSFNINENISQLENIYRKFSRKESK